MSSCSGEPAIVHSEQLRLLLHLLRVLWLLSIALVLYSTCPVDKHGASISGDCWAGVFCQDLGILFQRAPTESFALLNPVICFSNNI